MYHIYVEAEKAQIDDFKKLSDDELFHKVDCLTLHGYKEAEYETINAWDALHYILTGVTTQTPIPNNLFSEAILGVERFINDPRARYITYIYPDRVAQIAQALDEIDIDKELERITLEDLNRNNVYPGEWEDFLYDGQKKDCLGDAFDMTRDFFDLARDHGRGAIIRLTESCEGRRCIFFKGEQG